MIAIYLKNALNDSFNFNEYLEHLVKLTSNQQTTGKHQSERNIKFTKLNINRLKRIYKLTEPDSPSKQILKNISINQIWLTLSEGWCGDAAQSLPVIAKLASENEKITFLIASRDDHMKLMNYFLTDGNKAIPIVIILNDKFEVLNHWGPRPTEAHKLTIAYKSSPLGLNEEYHQKLQMWYNNDKGSAILKEFSQILIS